MVPRNVSIVAVLVLAAMSFAREARAATITFDAPIVGTPAPDDISDPFDFCVVFCAYSGTAGNEGVFTTQGFQFRALTNSGPGDHGEGIVVDPSLVGVPDNGTDYLLAGGIVQMTAISNTPFSLLSVQAADLDPSDPNGGHVLRIGSNPGGVAQFLSFTLTGGFQTFNLPSTWIGLTFVNFSGRLTAADNSPRVVGIDNINVEAVPEPASLVLLGTGLAVGVGLRRRRRP